MSDNTKPEPADAFAFADTEPGPPDDARDPVRDVALLLRAFLVCTGQEPMPEPPEG
jgi:hypothetical protein